MQKMDFEPLHALPGPVGCASPGARAHSGRPGLETLGGDAARVRCLRVSTGTSALAWTQLLRSAVADVQLVTAAT